MRVGEPHPSVGSLFLAEDVHQGFFGVDNFAGCALLQMLVHFMHNYFVLCDYSVQRSEVLISVYDCFHGWFGLGCFFSVLVYANIRTYIYTIQTFFNFFFCVFSAQTHFWTKLVQRPQFPSLDFLPLPQTCEQNDAGQQSQNCPYKQDRPPAFALLWLLIHGALDNGRVTQY